MKTEPQRSYGLSDEQWESVRKVERKLAADDNAWTPDYVANLIENCCWPSKKVAEAHNAALAAKDELHAAALQVLERHHQQQLAAEREKVAPPVDNKFVSDGCVQFGQSADAEAVFVMNRSLLIEVEELKKQLAAVRAEREE